MRAPEFWSRDDPASRVLAQALSPLGLLYGASVAWKAKLGKPYRTRAKVICVGGLVAGGSGKTPLAIAIAQAVLEGGRKPVFLTRGYRGSLNGPVWVDPEKHTSLAVGDEALLLARTAPVVVAHNRRAGAAMAETCDVIVMDDGHQNFQLAKDLSIVVIDADNPVGNGRMLPAGPLREPPKQALARANAIVLMGNGSSRIPHFRGPTLRASLVPVGGETLRGARCVAFAGIGRPQKFFETLRELGAELADCRTYADHHAYGASEIAALKALAMKKTARLITTEKDYVRVSPAERDGIEVLPVAVSFEDRGDLLSMIDAIVRTR